MEESLNLNTVSFNDDMVYNCEIDYEQKVITISFDWYFDIIKRKIIVNPINLVIKNWSLVTFSRELHSNPEEEIFQETGANILPVYEILRLEFRENYIYLHAVAYDDDEEVYCYYKFYDASLSFILLDMTAHENVYENINEIEEIKNGGFFVANIPPVENLDELINNLIIKTHIPPNLNCSWENLSEIISNAFWINIHGTLAIVHNNISHIGESEFELYYDVIEYCRLRTLHVYFVFDKEVCTKIRKMRQERAHCSPLTIN